MIELPVGAVSFDVNGTLIHSSRLGEVYSEVLSRHGIEVDSRRARETVRTVWKEFSCRRLLGEERFSSHPNGSRGFWYQFIDRVCEHLGGGSASPFAKAELFESFARPDPWDIYKEVPGVLRELQALRMPMIVVSNWDDRLPVLLERLGLAGYFEAIIYSQGVGTEKPQPAIFRDALDQLGLPAERVVHIGDRQREDVEGAWAVGMQALHLCRGQDGGHLRDLRPLVEMLKARETSRQETASSK